jgi:glucokinase
MSTQKKYTIGFDLGGTKLAAALVRSDGHIVDFIKVPVNMNQEKSAKKTQKRIINLITEIALDFKARFPAHCSAKNFKGIGLASAGPMNVEEGTLLHPVNYPGWKIVPLKKLVENSIHLQGFKTKVYFQNDAMAAALAEKWIGSAVKLKSFAVITVGTGVGSGVILNNRPCQSRGAGSEFGHLIIDFKALKDSPHVDQNSVEGFASGNGLISRARALGFKKNSVEELVAEKNPKYKKLYKDMAWALATLCYNLSVGFNLDAIFISGGLIKIKDLYLSQTKKNYSQMIRQFNSVYECPLEIAKTGNKAGVLGAAYIPYLP